MPPLLFRRRRAFVAAALALVTTSSARAHATPQDAPPSAAPPPAAPTPAHGAHAKASTDKFDFGKVVAGSRVGGVLLLDAVGDAPLAITRVGVTCECAKLHLSTARRLNVPIDREDQGKTDLVLQPGERATLEVTVDTTKLAAGPFQKGLKVYCSDPGSPLCVDLLVTVERPPKPEPPAPKPDDAKLPDVDPNQTAPKPIVDAPPPSIVPQPSQLQSGPPPKIECDQERYDFQEVYRGETVHHTFKIRNRGEGDLLIDRIKNSCACTAAKLTIGGKSFGPDEIRDSKRFGTLKTGEEATLDVEFKTAKASVPGKDVQLDKRILIYSNDLTRNPLSLSLDATMTSPFTVAPERLDFGVVKHGQSKSVSVLVYSDKLQPFEVTEAHSPNDELMKVALEKLPDDGKRPPTYQVTATVLPTAPLGSYSNRVELVVNHPRVKEISIPVELLSEPNVTFSGNNKPDVAPFLDFNVLTPGQEKTLEIHVDNGDPAVPYLPKSVTLEAKPISDGFKTELVEVEKGVKYVVKVTAPVTQAKLFFNGFVVITADHPDVPVQKIGLRGWCKGAGP